MLLRDELRQKIGYAMEPVVVEIDKTVIRRFVEGVEDANPLWLDEDFARANGHPTIPVPPSLLSTIMFTGSGPRVELGELIPRRGLDGGGEWQFIRPLYLGDTITAHRRITDMVERLGRNGPTLWTTTQVDFYNQRNELVAKAQSISANFD